MLTLLLLTTGLSQAGEGIAVSMATWQGPLHLRACPDTSRALPAQMEDAVAAVVLLETGDRVGSGVVASPDGFVLTAAHVVAGSAPVSLSFLGGEPMPVQRIRVDEVHDVALLALERRDADWPCLPTASAPTPLGTELFAIGSPGGRDLSHTVSKGIVSGKRDWEGHRFLQTDAALSPGNSGGPLLDATGHVIGIVSWKITAPGFEGLSFGVSVEALGEFLDLSWTDISDADPTALAGRREVLSGAISSLETSPFARREPPRGIGSIAAGGLLGTAGVLTALGTWGYYAIDPAIGSEGWVRLQAANAVGWGAVGAGAALVGFGLIVLQGQDVALEAGPTGLTMRGSF